jgi:PAS domain S-box-containing protein
MVDRFQQLFDSLTEEVVVVDRDLRVRHANSAWLDRVGFTSSKILGRPYQDLLPTPDGRLAPELKAAQQAFDTGRPVRPRCGDAYRRASGSHSNLCASPVLNSAGQVSEVVLVFHDTDSPGAPAEDTHDGSLADGSGEAMDDMLLPILRELQQVVHYDSAIVSLNTDQGWRALCRHGILREADFDPAAEPLAASQLAQMRETGRPQILAELQSESGWVPPPSLEQACACIGAPLLDGDRVIGVLALYKAEAGFYEEDDARVVMAFAGQATAAITNARLRQQTESFAAELVQRAERLDMVNRISLAVNSTLDLDQILQTATREVARVFEVRQTGIILIDHESGYGRMAAEFQETPDATGARVRIPIADNASLQRVMATREPVAIADARQDPLTASIRDVIELRNIQSILIVPLVSKGEVIGTIGLDAIDTPRIFSPDEIELAQTIANQIVVAIENARLFAAEAQRRREAETLQAATQAISSTLDLQTILERILSELRQVVPYDSASVQQLEEGSLKIIGGYGFSNLEELIGLRFDLETTNNPNRDVVHSRAPLILRDAPSSYQQFQREPHAQANIRSWMGVPLLFGDHPVGMLALDKQEPDFYSEEHARLALAFAAQAAIAIENSRLYQGMSRHLEEVQVLNKVALAATSTLDFDEVVRRVLATLREMRSFERVHILLLDEERNDLWLHPALADSDVLPKRADIRIPLGKGITGRVAQSGVPARVSDTRLEPEYVPGYPDSRSELCLPLRIGERIIGVLDVQNTQVHAFSASDERLLSTLASQLSTVLENSRLYAETYQHVRELASLMEVSQALNEAENLETILDIVLEEAFALIGTEEGSIILIDPPDSDRLRIVAERGLGAEVVHAFNSRPVSRHEGTYRRTLSTGQIVEVADTSADPDFLDDVGSRAKQVTNVPLIAERGPIGLIAVDGLPRNDTRRRLLMTLAGIAAVAIDKERLHQETIARLAEVSTLYTLSTQITSSLSTSAVLQAIATILRMTLDCRACSIFLIDKTAGYLQLEVASGPSAVWKGIARLNLGEGISGRVIAEQRSIYIPDTRLEPDFIFFDPDIRSLLVVPLLARGEVIGTLSIDDTEPNSFDEELRLLTIAGAQAAVAIENAQLYESLQSSYEELEHAFDELRHLDNSKSELIQNISHELRTPLTFIKGYVELLQEGELGPLAEEQQQAVEIVASKSEVLSTLVDDILSMLQAGREQIRMGPVSMSKVGHFAVQAARASAEDIGLKLVEEIPDGLPLVQGEMRRLGQVFDNLIQNAIKFSKPGGTITIRIVEEETQIRAEVQDNGIGIPPDELDRIFVRFYQVDGTTTRHFRGTGLGLAIVKQIVEAHGGQVGVHSKVGEGSTFFFTIPKTIAERR